MAYDVAKVATEAQHWVRFKVGAVKVDASPALDDKEVEAALAVHGLTPTTPPSTANRPRLYKAAADLCRSIAAAFARQGGVVVGTGPAASTKNLTADTYLKLAAQLEAQGTAVQQGDIEPFEVVDSVDYRRDRFGQDQSEYVGDEVT